MSKNTEYVVIVGRCWMNERGHGTSWSSDLERFPTNRAAQKHGLTLCGSDDFNIGRLVDGRLVALLWMDKVIDESRDELDGIADEIGILPTLFAFTAPAPDEAGR